MAHTDSGPQLLSATVTVHPRGSGRWTPALTSFHEQGLAPEAGRAIYSWYVTKGVANGGKFTQDDAEEFRALATKPGLSKDFVRAADRVGEGGVSGDEFDSLIQSRRHALAADRERERDQDVAREVKDRRGDQQPGEGGGSTS